MAWPEPRSILPHGERALLLERVLAADARALTAVGRVPRDSPLRRGDTAPAAVAIELAGQAAGVWRALASPDVGAARWGRLAGVPVAVFESACVPLDTELTTTVELQRMAGPLCRLAFTVQAGALPIARGELVLSCE
jgi:predicted hotdog family 3-hydroxylacyl-ACP dehydratase